MEGRVPVTVFHVDGKLNATDPLLSEAQKAYTGGARHMLIDMKDVPYVSSAGMRAIHEIYNMLRDKSETSKVVSEGLRAGTYTSPHLKVLKPNKLVVEVFKAMGFDMFIEIHNDLDKAIESF